MKNPAFWRAIHSLAHPISLIAILALLLNDHFLRIESPSWLTGKLGDFAWLVFAPFICAAVLAWLIRGRRQEKIVGIGAFVFIGVWFALAKTTPLVHGWTMDALEIIVGYRGTLRIDPTDLITLPALLIGWRVWRQAQNTPQTLKPRAWVLLALGTIGTVATSYPPPNFGVTNLCLRGNTIFASFDGFVTNVAAGYSSQDGGITWESIDRLSRQPMDCENPQVANDIRVGWPYIGREVKDLSDGTHLFRFLAGISIDRSDDGGETWVSEFDLTPLVSGAYKTYYENLSGIGYAVFVSGPLDALVESRTGNLVVAMGLQGVLVRTPDGQWQWAEVGVYRHVDLTQANITGKMIGYEAALALILILLTPTTIARPMSNKSILAIISLMILWAMWVVSVLFFPIAFDSTFGFSFGRLGRPFIVPIVGLSGLIIFFRDLVEIYTIERRAVVSLLMICGYTGLFFLLPYISWIRGTLPFYTTAMFFALLIAVTTLIAGHLHLKREYKDLFKLSQKQKITQLLAAGEIVFEEDEDTS